MDTWATLDMKWGGGGGVNQRSASDPATNCTTRMRSIAEVHPVP